MKRCEIAAFIILIFGSKRVRGRCDDAGKNLNVGKKYLMIRKRNVATLRRKFDVVVKVNNYG